jgi:hypothetical protein
MGCYAGVRRYSKPTPVAAMSGIRVRTIAMGRAHTIALGWDGRIHSWGENEYGQLGQGDRLTKLAPALMDGLDGVRFIAAGNDCSLAVTQSGALLCWGSTFNFLKQPREESTDTEPSDDSDNSDDFDFLDEALVSLLPVTVEGFEGVRICWVCCDESAAFAIGEDGEPFSWGDGTDGRLGHGDRQNQPSPKLVEALRGVRVSSVACGHEHVLAVSEDGLVYAWGKLENQGTLGNAYAKRELLPEPIEALRGVRIGSVATAYHSSYAVADTGELWALGVGSGSFAPLGNGCSGRHFASQAGVGGRRECVLVGPSMCSRVGCARPGPFSEPEGESRAHAAAHPSAACDVWWAVTTGRAHLSFEHGRVCVSAHGGSAGMRSGEGEKAGPRGERVTGDTNCRPVKRGWGQVSGVQDVLQCAVWT